MTETLTRLSFVALLLGASALLNVQVRNWDGAWVEAPRTQTFKTDPRLVRILSFGHVPVVAHWLWIRCLVDSAVDRVQPGTHAATFYDFDLITDLDPAFLSAYVDAATLLSVLRHDYEGARYLLTKGMRFVERDLPGHPEAFRAKYWANPWKIPMTLGYVELFNFHAFANAGAAFQKAAQFPDAPLHIKSLSERLLKPGGAHEVGMRLLGIMINGTADPAVRRSLEKKRESLYLAQFVFQTNHAFQSYLNGIARYRATTYVTPQALQGYWRDFLKQGHGQDRDPMGGRLYLDKSGKVATTTPYEEVLGLK